MKTTTITVPVFLTNLFMSWKSSAVGVASLVRAAFIAHQQANLAATFQDPQFQIMLFLGLLGLVSKDAGVTGGDKGQPSTPEALADSGQASKAEVQALHGAVAAMPQMSYTPQQFVVSGTSAVLPTGSAHAEPI